MEFPRQIPLKIVVSFPHLKKKKKIRIFIFWAEFPSSQKCAKSLSLIFQPKEKKFAKSGSHIFCKTPGDGPMDPEFQY